ncbi:MAG: ABC transporter ATP-binding protein [bacterium]
MLAIKVDNLTKSFKDVHALKNVSLEIKQGEFFALLGPNGAGKTTFIKILSGLSLPSNGTVYLNGINVVINPSQIKQMIGVVPQDLILYDNLNGRENMEIFGTLYNIENSTLLKRIDLMLNLTGITDVGDKMVKEYSGGMKRRLNLAVALLHDPKILFLDEPTVGLDPHIRKGIWELMRSLNKEGVTIILATHYMDEAESLCGRIGILNKGELVVIGALNEIKEQIPGETLDDIFIKLVE